MKKIVVSLVGILLFLTSNFAFAQIDKVYKGARSVQELNNVVERAVVSQLHIEPVWHVRIPAGITHENWATLKASVPANMPVESLRINLSEFRQTVAAKEVSSLNMRGDRQDIDGWLLEQWAFSGKGFYEDDGALAQDLDAFYTNFQSEKSFARYQSTLGEEVRFYPLPVNGILYKPVGHDAPLLLDSNHYFIIYNVATKTGQVAPQNSPMLKFLFSPLKN